MAPRKFQPIPLSERPEDSIVPCHEEPSLVIDSYGQQNSFNATVPYAGSRRSVNATVNAPELQAGIRKQKKDFAKCIQENAEYMRVAKGRRSKTHKLPIETEYLDNGEVKVTRPTTTTHRTEN